MGGRQQTHGTGPLCSLPPLHCNVEPLPLGSCTEAAKKLHRRCREAFFFFFPWHTPIFFYTYGVTLRHACLDSIESGTLPSPHLGHTVPHTNALQAYPTATPARASSSRQENDPSCARVREQGCGWAGGSPHRPPSDKGRPNPRYIFSGHLRSLTMATSRRSPTLPLAGGAFPLALLEQHACQRGDSAPAWSRCRLLSRFTIWGPWWSGRPS